MNNDYEKATSEKEKRYRCTLRRPYEYTYEKNKILGIGVAILYDISRLFT